jgi:VCBS repeat-containing protein
MFNPTISTEQMPVKRNYRVAIEKSLRWLMLLAFLTSLLGIPVAPVQAAPVAQEVAQAPAAPLDLQAVGVDGAIQLSWAASPEADLAGYNLYRGVASGVYDPYPVNGPAFILESSYTDSGLANGTVYFYVVKAVNAAGVESAYSKEVSATPQGSVDTQPGAQAVTVARSDGNPGVDAITSTTVNLTAAEDTYMDASNATSNYNASTTLQIDQGTGTSRRGTLLKWDLSTIPPYATITSASLTFNVTNTSTIAYNLYQIRRFWVGEVANWNAYNGSATWSSVGAADTTNDRYNTNLWDATTSSWSTAGSKTVTLNANGITVLNSWLTSPISNYGFTVQSYTSTTNNLIISSSEDTTAANRPKLNVTYDVPSSPTIVTVGSLAAFTSTPNAGSSEQNYTVYGNSLTEAITVTAPTGFQVSTTSGSSFGSTLTLTPTSGVIAKTTIYVRQYSASTGSFSGNITHTSSGATTQNVAASGTVASCATANLTPTADTFLNYGNNKGPWNFGGAGSLQLNPWYASGQNDQQRDILLLWDLSSIPSDATINAASLTFYVTLTENAYTYSLYSMRRSWMEGTLSGAQSSSTTPGATYGYWNYYNGSAWGTEGAANTSSDRYDTNLWGATASDFNVLGSKTFDMNASGVTVIQGWLTAPENNFGLTIQNLSGSSTGSWSAASRNNQYGLTKPTLRVTYCLSTTPTIAVTPSSLTGFSAPVGTPSAEQSYTVSGTNLTANLVVTAPTDFEVSTTSGSGFGSSVSLTPSGGTVSSTTIYVRLNPTSATTYSANITNASTGATTQNVAVSGTSVPLITTTGTLTAFNSAVGIPSAEQSYTVSGVRLTAPIVVTPPTDFEVSTSSGSGFGASVSLTPTNGTVSSTTIYVRLSPTSATTYSANITHASTNATTQNVAVSGTSVPSITTTGTLSAFNSAVGIPSAEQSYTVSGVRLSEPIVVTPPADFEVSTSSGSGFGALVSLTPTNGTVSSTTIYVRLSPTSATTYSANITHASTNATPQNVAVSGSSVPAITKTSSMTAFSAYTGQYSSTQTYSVSALNLIADLLIAPPVNFEVSLSSGSGFVANPGTLVISPVSGVISSTTIYARFKSATAQTVNGSITHNSSGATQQTVDVSGTAITPPGTIAKSVDKTTAGPGDTLNYTIDGLGYANSDLLTNVTVTDSIPSGTTYVADSDAPEATVTPADDGTATLLTWNLGSNAAGTPGSTGGTGTVALDGTVSTGGSTAAGLTLTFSHTTGSGSNRLLLVGVAWRNTSVAIPISGVTFNSVTMNLVGSNTSTNNRRLAIYSLLNPPASTTGNVVVTLGGTTNATDIVAGAANFSGVDQTTPLGTFATAYNTSTSATAPTVNVATAANDLVFDTVVAANGTLTVGSGQTQRWNFTPTTGNITTGGSTEPATTTSTTMSWTSTAGAWAIGAVPIKPATGAARTTTLSAYPTLVSTGVPFTLKATLTNTVADTNVTPGSLTPTVTGGASVSCGAPSPASGSISAGGSLEFTWTCTPTASSTAFGSVALSVSANGASYSYPSGLSNTVLVVPALTFQVVINNPPDVSQIENYTTLDDSGSYLMPLNSNTATTIIATGPTIITSGTLSTFSTALGTPSAAQTYTVAGSYLTDDISITAPTGFELSTDGTTYYSSLTLTQSGGSVATTTVYVRLTGTAAGTFDGNIVHTSSGATTVNKAVSGAVIIYYTLTADTDGNGTLTLSPAGGSYPSGTTVTLTPLADTGYEFSDWSGTNALELTDLGNGSYTIVMNGDKTVYANFAALPVYTLTTAVSPEGAGSITLNPSGGSYYKGTVVQLTASANSGFSFSNWIGHLSGSTNPTTITMDSDKFVTAVFTTAQTCNTVNLVENKDTWMHGSSPTNNNGAATTLYAHGYSTGRGALMQWDLSGIPTAATVTAASLTIQVTDASAASPGYIYNLYEMKQTWVEGTGNGTASGDGATFNSYDGNTAHTWEAGGAAGTTTDRYGVNLWDQGLISSTGVQTFALNNSGIAAVQDWVTIPANNKGLTLQNYVNGTTTDTFGFYSSDSTSGTKPTLNVTYCTGGTATYTLTMTNDGHGTVTLNPSGGSYTAGTVVTLTPVPSSGYEFATWTGTNAEDPSDNGDGTWSLTMNSNKSIQANFSLIPVNVAPNAPVLVQPTDAATAVSIPATLEVTASDPNSTDTSLTVNFYGRPAGTTAGADFTLALIPDPQNYTANASRASTYYNGETNWIVANQTTSNIVFATTTGDLVNTATNATEYGYADAAFDILDAGGVPYSVGPGNHDYALTNYNVYFGTSRFSGKSWYQGAAGTGNENNYSFFSASGNDFILINLGYNPSTTYMDWADALLKANPTKRGIVVSHSIINIDNSWTYQALYTSLKDNPNLFLMLCGHMHSSSDGAAYRAELGDDGHTIHIVQADYQDYPNGGNGYLRLLRFSPANDKIYATTYSAVSGGSLTTYPDQMEMVYDLASGSGAAYTLIGTATVANGANASTSWSGLSATTQYEWYATVSDGTETVTGPTWSFTTGSSNQAPTDISLSNSSLAENSAIDTIVGTLSTSDPDSGNTFTYSLVSGTGDTDNASFNISGSSLRSSAVFDYETKNSYSLRVRSTDQGGLFTEKAFTISVTNVNEPPEIVQGSAISTAMSEDGSPIPFSLTLYASDPDAGTTLTWSISSPASHGVATTSSTGTTGIIHYAPAANYNGSDSFVVQVSDGSLADTITVNVDIEAVNDAPVANAQSVSTPEDTARAITLTATDVENDPLTYHVVTGPVHGGLSGTAPDLTYTPESGYSGPDSFTFTANDGDLDSNEATVSITVTAVNSAPVITEGASTSVSMAKNGVPTAFALTLHATDADVSDTLTWGILTPALHGTASASGTGLTRDIWYTPLTDYVGSDSFEVQVSDGNGGADKIVVNVTVLDTHGVDLHVGWNLVSFTIHPTSTAITDVLATVNGNFDLVYAWDGATQAWQKYDNIPGSPDSLNSLDETRGFWINMTGADTLIVVGNAPATSSIPLKTGWNLVGYPGATSQALPGVLSDHGVTDFSLVYAYDGLDTADPWKMYDHAAPAYANDLAAMAPGWGYWILVGVDQTWAVAY